MTLFDRLGGDDEAACRCTTSFVDPVGTARHRDSVLELESGDCPGGGDLVAAPDCRETAIGALESRDAAVVRTHAGGVERVYDDGAAALLVAAGRFVERVAFHDEELAARARRDPLRAALDATGRAGVVSDLAAETGLAELAARAEGYEDALRPLVGPRLARSRVALGPPDGAVLQDRRELPVGGTVRLYETEHGTDYHLTPPSATLDPAAAEVLDAAYERLAAGVVDGGDRAPARAVRACATEGDPVELLADILYRHTRGHGHLDVLLADSRVTDVFANAPVQENPVRVTVDGERRRTNVRLTPDGAAALASRFRQTSGRAFSRATPVLDAVVEPSHGGRVRVSGVTSPVSDGLAFAFRRHGGAALTLPALVENETLTAAAAALLSVAVERGAATLVAGPRGAGKTTLLGGLLFELDPASRTVVIEDTPELPVETLREQGRDVQGIHADVGDDPVLDPTGALRAALRLGDGALVVGEVRGEEAAALYEAMRVGESDDAVLGTIHGDGAAGVRERLVTDLGVPDSSFAATDLVVTVARGDRRRVVRIEEVRAREDGTSFQALYELDGGDLGPSGAVARGDSHLLASLALPGESYAAVHALLERRERDLAALAASARTRPGDVAAAYHGRVSET